MNPWKWLTSLVVATCLTMGGARAADNADDDLRQAAKLHRQGDTSAAITIWQRWATRDNVDAAYNLAVIHQYGDGVEKNSAEALKWYRFAAERNDRVSQFQLGLMYQVGEGVPADARIAHEWYTKHRRDHMHHEHSPQMQTWRKQALAMIEARDRQETSFASRRDGAQVLADLRRRAGLTGTGPGKSALALAAEARPAD